MNTHMEHKDIKQVVINKIKNKEVVMRSRAYFVWQVVVIAFLAGLIFLLLTYAISFILFSVHESGEQFLLGFGFQGVYTFLTLFPWWAFLAILLLGILTEYLLRRFRFGYRTSLLRVFGGLFVMAIILGTIIDFTPLHNFLLDKANRGELPLFGSAYESIRTPHRDEGVFRGVVDSISARADSFVISHDDFDNDADDGIFMVIAPSGFDVTLLSSGDRVYVAGTSSNDVIYAYGVGRF